MVEFVLYLQIKIGGALGCNQLSDQLSGCNFLHLQLIIWADQIGFTVFWDTVGSESLAAFKSG